MLKNNPWSMGTRRTYLLFSDRPIRYTFHDITLLSEFC